MDEEGSNEVVYLGTQEALAAHLGVERKTISRWQKRKDCPGRGEHGFDVAAWKAFVERNGLGRTKSKSKADLEAEKLALSNERARLINQKLRGEVASVEEVVKVLASMASGFSLTLHQNAPTVAEEVVGCTVGEATKRIRNRNREALGVLALGEWAQKKTFWSKVFAALSDPHKISDLGLGQSAT